MVNIDRKVVEGFGDEWSRFDQSELDAGELQRTFDGYFRIFPWEALPAGAQGFDMGCGSGRWARLVAPRVGKLHCVDPSAALEVARRNLAGQANCEFHRASVDDCPLPDGSQDFGYCLGVLHHIPDTARALAACTRRLKPGAPFLVYLYYAFDNRPWWFKAVWRASNAVRLLVSRLPMGGRYLVSQLIAGAVYWPLARSAKLLEQAGLQATNFPLWFYRDKSFYMLRTDALDRFGTRLEQRFTREEIRRMMEAAGLERVTFSDAAPFWCALGYRGGTGA
jgi:ubiquinone/menaquinone biosynthesis C-methylase UbiE